MPRRSLSELRLRAGAALQVAPELRKEARENCE